MGTTVMQEVQRSVRELTCTMESWEYAEFMRALADWAETQADLAEYMPDYEPDYDTEDD